MTIMSAATTSKHNAASAAASVPAVPSEPVKVDFEAVSEDELLAEVNGRQEDGLLKRTDDWLEALGAHDGAGIEDANALEEAAAWWRRGDHREALHYLEIALGRDFTGLGEILR